MAYPGGFFTRFLPVQYNRVNNRACHTKHVKNMFDVFGHKKDVYFTPTITCRSVGSENG